MNKLRYFLATEKGQTLMGVFYSLGASVVILGALFKILHLPGAGPMLAIGMGTEAFLFALGALEIPHKSYDWGIVFPALKTPHGEEPPEDAAISGANLSGGSASSTSGNDILGSLVASGELKAEDVQKLADGIKKLGKTASSLNELSTADSATRKYITNLDEAATTLGKVKDLQNESAESIKESLDTLGGASKELVSSYSKLSDSMVVEMKVMRENSEESQRELVNFNKNLAAINAAYEIQLNYANQQVDSLKGQLTVMEDASKNVGSLKSIFADTIADSEGYKAEASKLKDSIAELNSVYGNMLSALNINK